MAQVQNKIHDAYKVALKLGVKNATQFEKEYFLAMLNQISVATIDEAKREIFDLMDDQADRCVNRSF